MIPQDIASSWAKISVLCGSELNISSAENHFCLPTTVPKTSLWVCVNVPLGCLVSFKINQQSEPMARKKKRGGVGVRDCIVQGHNFKSDQTESTNELKKNQWDKTNSSWEYDINHVKSLQPSTCLLSSEVDTELLKKGGFKSIFKIPPVINLDSSLQFLSPYDFKAALLWLSFP